MRSIQGIVISNKMKNTLVVQVHSYKTHPKYKKRFRVSKKYYVDDPEEKSQINDTVTIYETRPLSRLKRWTIVKPAKKASLTSHPDKIAISAKTH